MREVAAGLEASVSLFREGRSPVSTDRTALLRAVEETGSISGAARRLRLSYRGAWDQVQALNNLFESPLIVAERGRLGKGNAVLTPRGRAMIDVLERVRAELTAAVARVGDLFDGDIAADLFWSLGMKTSVRNALRGRVTEITRGAVNGEVVVALSDEAQIVSILAHRDIDGLGLMPGAAVVVLIQAGDIVLVQGDGLRTSARNRLPGRVSGREDGAVNSEISLNIGGAKTLVATVTLESARALDLTPGAAVTALVKAPHVILATET
jgi:molybdate transport system regulatory protein